MAKKTAKITEAEVRKVALLARLELTETEVAMYADQLSAILGYIQKLEEVDTENIPMTSQVTGLSNVMREDEVEAWDEPEVLVKMAPDQQNNLVKVKAVFE